MSWFADRVLTHVYRHPESGEGCCIEMTAAEERPDVLEDGSVFVETLPDRFRGMFKVQFERNGRIGYKYDLGGGKGFIRSATRERYEHNIGNMSESARKSAGTGVNDSVYSRGFQKVVDAERRRKEKGE